MSDGSSRYLLSHIIRLGFLLVTKVTLDYTYIAITKHTNNVKASCSYEVQDIICIHINGLLEDVTLL